MLLPECGTVVGNGIKDAWIRTRGLVCFFLHLAIKGNSKIVCTIHLSLRGEDPWDTAVGKRPSVRCRNTKQQETQKVPKWDMQWALAINAQN